MTTPRLGCGWAGAWWDKLPRALGLAPAFPPLTAQGWGPGEGVIPHVVPPNTETLEYSPGLRGKGWWLFGDDLPTLCPTLVSLLPSLSKYYLTEHHFLALQKELQGPAYLSWV